MSSTAAGGTGRSGRDEIETRIGERLMARGWSIATGESCTGGLLAGRFTDVSGSSRYFAGGVIAYSDSVKTALLGVSPQTLGSRGAVSEDVAREMARGAARALGADVGVSVTGIAGPGGAVPGKPIGTVCFGISVSGGVRTERVRFEGDRRSIREQSVTYALELVMDSLVEEISTGTTDANPARSRG